MAYQSDQMMRRGNRNCKNKENAPLKHHENLAKEAPSILSCPQMVREENMHKYHEMLFCTSR